MQTVVHSERVSPHYLVHAGTAEPLRVSPPEAVAYLLELGMAHYEVRKYPGWHHHMLTTMLAHFFLWHLKLRLGEKSPGADGVTAADCSSQWYYPTAR